MKRKSCGRKYISLKFKIYSFFESYIIIRYILSQIFKLISTSEQICDLFILYYFILFINISAKKTRPTQENEENSNSGKDNQLFDIKPTERIVIQHKGKERRDKYGNLITKKGKQKVTFIDKVENKKFEVIVNIESFKEFNKTEVKLKNLSQNM